LVETPSQDRNLKLLIVEDSEDDCLLVVYTLRQAGLRFNYVRIDYAPAFRQALLDESWDVIISDYNLPEFSAPEALDILNDARLDIPFIVISGVVDEQTIIKLMKSGARDCVMKDHLGRLPGAIERELKEAEARRQLRRVEEQFRQAQKMEAIGRLASGVAHDFNNLLTIITGFAQLALLEPNPAQSGLEQILRAAERAAVLTRQLLVFSRQQSLEVRVFDLNTLLRDLEKMIRRIIGEDVETRTVFHEQEALVRADPNQMEQVILNLVVNSRDAMPRGGTLTLETQYYDVDASSSRIFGCLPGLYAQVSVSDTGMGMDKATLAKIFEPFFTTKDEGRGTGLGLSTVYGIINQSGGAIRTYSEPGVGTTMRILLPAVSEKAPVDRALATNQPQRGSETVLLVEDDETVLALCSTVLQTLGYNVLEAESAINALDISRSYRGHIHLLLTDVVMPGSNGPALAVEIRDIRPDIRTLFMSGYTEDTMNRHGFDSRTAGFIQKPFSASALAQKVRHVLDAGKNDAGKSTACSSV
jgi:signal transduction histidine kinase/ActR/RegA family two-component response regulator